VVFEVATLARQVGYLLRDSVTAELSRVDGSVLPKYDLSGRDPAAREREARATSPISRISPIGSSQV
jgi:hypothetical protein